MSPGDQIRLAEFKTKVRWTISGIVSLLLLLVLFLISPDLPSFEQLRPVTGTINTSTADTRVEGGRAHSVFTIILDGAPNKVYAVVKGADPGYYRATQVVASGDDITMWVYPIKQSNDLRVWQLSDRNDLIVNYNEVYGFEKKYRNELAGIILFLIAVVNGWTYLKTWQANAEPPPPPRLLEMGG